MAKRLILIGHVAVANREHCSGFAFARSNDVQKKKAAAGPGG
jgi:hypothetical protein